MSYTFYKRKTNSMLTLLGCKSTFRFGDLNSKVYVLTSEKAVAGQMLSLGFGCFVRLPSFLPGHHDPRGAGEHRAQRPPSHVPLYSVSLSSGTV